MNLRTFRRIEARLVRLTERAADPTNVWFSKGELAFGTGQPRALADGRVSHQNREQFYAGWDAASRRQLAAQRSPEELDKSRARFARLKKFVEGL